MNSRSLPVFEYYFGPFCSEQPRFAVNNREMVDDCQRFSSAGYAYCERLGFPPETALTLAAPPNLQAGAGRSFCRPRYLKSAGSELPLEIKHLRFRHAAVPTQAIALPPLRV